MKIKGLLKGAVIAAAGYGAYKNRNALKAAYKLEKVQGDLFAKVDNDEGKHIYLSKNDKKSEELFQDWVAYQGWEAVNRVGEGFFFINDAEETLTITRDAVLNGRYILWTASDPIE